MRILFGLQNYMYTNILSWNIIEKKIVWPREENVRRRSQSTDMLCSRPSCMLGMQDGLEHSISVD